jgi:arabinofuranosyltransferase
MIQAETVNPDTRRRFGEKNGPTSGALPEPAPGKWRPVAPAVLAALSLVLFVVVLLRNACLVDDTYIGLRTVDNFVNGYGLTWNIAERVQAYTCPLWILLVSAAYFVTREAYFTTVFLSAAVSLLALAFVFRAARSVPHAVLAVLLLTFSKAFMDYSASGLENPLAHLLVAWFFCTFVCRESNPRTLLLLSFIAALGVVNRMDCLLVFAPALVYTWYRVRGWKGLALMALGFVPFLLWECFSLFYYGFLFPNTAYAKLGTGIDRWTLLVQGCHYLANSLRLDPVTLWGVFLCLAVPFLPGQRRLAPLAAGIVLYLLYVVAVGGDFMSGRFLTVPLAASVLLLVRCPVSSPRLAWAVGCAVVVTLGLLGRYPPILSGADYGRYRSDCSEVGLDHGIGDERGCYYPHAGFLNVLRQGGEPEHRWVTQGRAARRQGCRLAIKGNVGYFGFYAGPHVFVLDPGALADPLLARLPSVRTTAWRVGHFTRKVPAGYVESLLTGENWIADAKLAAYWDKIALVTRGPLFDVGRLRAIWGLNTGRYDGLIDRSFRDASRLELRLSELPSEAAADRYIFFPQTGVQIDLEGRRLPPRLEVSLPNDDYYEVLYLHGEETLARQVVRPAQVVLTEGMTTYPLDVPGGAVRKDCTGIRIVPIPDFNDRCCRIGHLRLVGPTRGGL